MVVEGMLRPMKRHLVAIYIGVLRCVIHQKERWFVAGLDNIVLRSLHGETSFNDVSNDNQRICKITNPQHLTISFSPKPGRK